MTCELRGSMTWMLSGSMLRGSMMWVLRNCMREA
jgi:hypothetical protein